MRALLPQLAVSGLLTQRLGRYLLNDRANTFLRPGSPYYWGPVFLLMRQIPMRDSDVVEQLQRANDGARWDANKENSEASGAWSAGEVTPDLASAIAAYMQANCQSAALGLAQCFELKGTRRLLDAGAGSGCYSIAFAKANPALRCTMMDLKGMAAVAMDYVRAAGVDDRIDTVVTDMLREEWPKGYDAILLSSIFHDWDFDTCALIAAKAFRALPSGGRILVHEMLLEDTHDGPPAVAAFSMYMLLGTKGQQFTADEIRQILSAAGFGHVRIEPAHGYYFVVTAEKP
jgi:acetylserotonin N-methyltransferase